MTDSLPATAATLDDRIWQHVEHLVEKRVVDPEGASYARQAIKSLLVQWLYDQAAAVQEGKR